VMLVLVAGLAVVSLQPSVVLFLLCFAYGLHGYVLWGMGARVRRAPEE